MSTEDIRTSSDSEDEAIQDAIDDDDEVRYSLRSRSVSKAQLVNHGGLETSSAELVASHKRTLALARGAPPVSGTTMTDVQDGEDQRVEDHIDLMKGTVHHPPEGQRGDELSNQMGATVRHPPFEETSPFELRTARVTRAQQLPTVPPYDYWSRRFMSSPA